MPIKNDKIKLSKNKEPILTPDQICESFLNGTQNISVLIEDEEEFSAIEKYSEDLDSDIDIGLYKKEDDILDEEFHSTRTYSWVIPKEYLDINITEYLLSRCNTTEEENRVLFELKKFEQNDMFNILRLMIYLISYMRENGHVWGVGRGSSVSSYCLYLIGVHKVDSIKYNLDVEEFFK